MCEFCTEHGEGKKWYLQMKNYAKELYLEELSADRKKIVEANTRLEWNNRFWEAFVMPAFKTTPKPEDKPSGIPKPEPRLGSGAAKPEPRLGSGAAKPEPRLGNGM